jgi:cytochrome oxidase assembly protein ShyY1
VDRSLLAPRWLAIHVAVLVVVVACGLLGAWQLDRARDQRDQSARAATNADLAVVELDTVLPLGAELRLDDLGRPVEVRGHYDPGAQLVVPGRDLDGATGSLVLDALVTDDGSAVMVIRGWRAGSASDPAPAPPTGSVVVTGWLGASERPPSAEMLPAGQVGSVHVPTLVNLVPYALRDGFVAATSEDPSAPGTGAGLIDLPPPVRIEGGGLPLQNVFYAIEWWVFGLAAVVLWGSAVRRRNDPIRPARSAAGTYSTRS